MRKLAAAILLIAVPALAQEAPRNIQPTRDVAVTYRFTGPSAEAQEMRMAWSATERKQRIDPPGGMGWMLLDRNAGSAVMVMEQQRMVMNMPATASAGPMTNDLPPGTRFARKGTAQLAGQSCTEWEVTMPEMRSTVCMTDDGVMLRAVSDLPGNAGRSTMEATEVRYGAQDPARFRVPQGYQSMPMPGAAPGGKPPGR
jgi:hypothetical protein